MKAGERWIAAAISLVVVGAVVKASLQPAQDEQSQEIPFYNTVDEATALAASDLYKQLNCRSCHTIWAVKNITETVPAPSLDGIGSLRDEAWLYDYFSVVDPQTMLPSRLKKEYMHPSYASLPEAERRLLARYFAGMKVKDWYFEETLRAEQKKLTGKDPNAQ
ncbi:MAG: cytochrome c [Zetaproteobacteria bacterium]|nr:cytochrome c [Zetaproteobacteria bacterium]